MPVALPLPNPLYGVAYLPSIFLQLGQSLFHCCLCLCISPSGCHNRGNEISMLSINLITITCQLRQHLALPSSIVPCLLWLLFQFGDLGKQAICIPNFSRDTWLFFDEPCLLRIAASLDQAGFGNPTGSHLSNE